MIFSLNQLFIQLSQMSCCVSITLFQLLEENIVTFVKDELKRFLVILNPDQPLEKQRDGENEEQESNREAFLNITLNMLRKMKQEELADCLYSSKRTFR